MKNYLFCGFFVGIIFFLSPCYANASMSSDAKELKKLYEELQNFKSDPKFDQVGFGTCCRFNSWMVRIKKIRSKKLGVKILKEVGFFPGDLLQLGMEYLNSKGRPTSYTKEMEATIISGLAPEPQLEDGQGVVVREDRACTSLDNFKKFIAAISANKFEDATNFLSGPDCIRVNKKTVVTGPLASQELSWGDGSKSTYHQVKIPDGTKLWMGSSQVKFREKAGG